MTRFWKTTNSINYDYYVRQSVLKYNNTIKGKLAIKPLGPFEIVCIHMNNTVKIQLRAGVTEQINICYTIPYRDPLNNWRFSCCGGECSALEMHYMSSCLSIPGNPDIPYPSEWLLFTTSLSVVRQTTDRWQKKGVRTLGDMLAPCALFPLWTCIG